MIALPGLYNVSYIHASMFLHSFEYCFACANTLNIKSTTSYSYVCTLSCSRVLYALVRPLSSCSSVRTLPLRVCIYVVFAWENYYLRLPYWYHTLAHSLPSSFLPSFRLLTLYIPYPLSYHYFGCSLAPFTLIHSSHSSKFIINRITISCWCPCLP